MNGATARRWLAATSLCAMAAVCDTGSNPNEFFPAEFTETWREFPLVEYANGQVTINDRCPVRQDTLNVRLKPLFVNGEAVGFC